MTFEPTSKFLVHKCTENNKYYWFKYSNQPIGPYNTVDEAANAAREVYNDVMAAG